MIEKIEYLLQQHNTTPCQLLIDSVVAIQLGLTIEQTKHLQNGG